MGIFDPDRFFSRITAIDVRADLVDVGFNHVLLDIDNTVRSRADGCIPRDVFLWLARARDMGVGFCLLSNNWHRDVYGFAAELGLPIVAKSCKPLPFGFIRGMHRLGSRRDDTVVIGDQLLTDVAGAHLSGLHAYLVLPLAEVDLKHTRYMRILERNLMGKRYPEPVYEHDSKYGRDPFRLIAQTPEGCKDKGL